MSYRIGTNISLILTIVLALVFLFTSFGIGSPQTNQPIKPATFPQILCFLLIIMCVISFFTTRRQEDVKVEMLNIRYIVYTVLGTILFLIVWESLNLFYLPLVVLLSGLFYLYNDSENVKGKIISSIVIAFIVATLIYLIFHTMLGVIF